MNGDKKALLSALWFLQANKHEIQNILDSDKESKEAGSFSVEVDGSEISLTEGICAYVDYYHSDTYSEMLKPYFPQWGYFSGSFTYPVPCDATNLGRDSAMSSFCTATAFAMWHPENPYGSLRWDLIDHIIKYIEKDLSEV